MAKQQRGNGPHGLLRSKKVEWGGALKTLRASSLSINEVVLLGRLEDRLATILMPCGSSTSLEWKAWCWPSSHSFQKAPSKAMYE